jgi:hypothetical protein
MKIADEGLALTECEIGVPEIQVVGAGPRRRGRTRSFMFTLNSPDFLFFFTSLLRR